MARFSTSEGGKRFSIKSNPYESTDLLKVRRRIFPKDSKWPWIIAISGFVLIVTLGSFTLDMSLSLESTIGNANRAMDSASSFLNAAKSGDQDQLKKSAQEVSKAAHAIDGEFDTPVWDFTSRLPFVGPDVQNVKTFAKVFIDVADNALIPMSESGNIMALKDFAQDDSLNFAVLDQVLTAVDEVIPVLNRSTRTLKSLPHANIPPLRKVLDNVIDKVSTVDAFVTRIRPLFPYLPEMFGADGQTHRYLVLAENNAEIHAIGGFVGSLGILSVTDGKIEMGDFQNLADVLSHIYNPAGATEEEIEVFGERVDTHHGDHNVIPDFQRVGQLYFNSWNYYQDLEVDGVLGLDVVFLQYLLDAFGSIETSYGVTVDGTNCAALLLNQSLFWWSPDQCDVFYREVAGEALHRILGNLDDIDLSKFITAITRATEQDRCSIWMRDEEIEEAMKRAGFARELKHDSTKPEVGIFISDYSVSKMSYYIGCDISVKERRINDDGSKTYDVEVLYTNNFDPKARDTFPYYLTVQNQTGARDEYDAYEEVRLIAPEGGTIRNVTSERLNTRGKDPTDGEGWVEHTYQGLDVMANYFHIDAQESVKIQFTVDTSPYATEDLEVRKTPLMPPEIAYWNEDLSASHPEWNVQKTV